MMKQFLQLLIGFIIFLLVGLNTLFAGDFSGDIKLNTAKQDILELDWEEVDGAYGYSIYYGTKTGVNSGYEFEYEDLIELTNVTLDKLESDTKYYVAVVAIDENGDEVAKSDEFSFRTLGGKKLLLNAVKVTGEKELELSFSSNIDEGKEKDLILTSLDSGEEIDLTNVEVFGKTLLLHTGNDFNTDEKYQVVIISLFGVDGTTITSGIDGSVRFTAPDMKIFDKNYVDPITTGGEVNDNEIPQEGVPSEVISDTVIDDTSGTDVGLASAGKEPTETKVDDVIVNANNEDEAQTNTVDLAGKELTEEELNQNIDIAAANKEDLPVTGPEHVFIMLLALLLGGLVIFLRGKKEANE